MNMTDVARLTKNYSLGGEKRVMGALWVDTEGDLLTALRRVLYRKRALALATLVEAALSKATKDLERLEVARGQAVAEAAAIRADYDAAQAELARMGRGTPRADRQRATGRLHKAARGLEVANREATTAIGQHRACQQRVTGMGRLLGDLRATEQPDSEVLRLLAEALHDAG